MKLKILVYLFIALTILLVSCNKNEIEEPTVNEFPELFVAGYLPWYGFDNFDFEALKYINRVYYFSIAPDSTGNFISPDIHEQNIQFLQNKIGESETELFIVVGGWYESETIFPMAADSNKREAYVNSLVQFCIENNLDGVDLDWEAYPTSVPETDYILLVDLLSEKLRENNLKFSVAVAASHYNLAAKFKNKVDQINIMSYGVLDEAGNQVTMSMLTKWLNNFDAAGVPRSKLIVGVPFYGKRPYNTNDNSARALTYRYIVQQSAPAYDENNYGKYSYNGRSLMQTKTKFLRENFYFGIMSWELSQDVDYNSQYSLLKSIVEVAK